MAARSRRRRPHLQRPSAADAVPDDMRRRDQDKSRPKTLPTQEEARTGEEPAGGGFTPSEDGGVDQHPIHDSDQEDATSSDYEREIDRIDAALDKRI